MEDWKLPHWIKNESLAQRMITDIKYIDKYLTHDLRDLNLFGPPPNEGPSFEERLRIATGGKIDDFLEHEQQKFIKDANERKSYQDVSREEKDTSLLKKMNILAQAINVDAPFLPPTDAEDLQNTIKQEENKELEQDHRILIDEIYKVLYLNNEDPYLYNVKFWSKHFKIDPAAIRNIFNYLGYPVVNPDTKSVEKTLIFIDVDMLDKQKLKDVTIGDFIMYLEEDYYRRKEIEHQEIMKGIQELSDAKVESKHLRQRLIEEPIYDSKTDPLQRALITDDHEHKVIVSHKIHEGYIYDESIMEQIEDEIEKFKKTIENEKARKKNQKIF